MRTRAVFLTVLAVLVVAAASAYAAQVLTLSVDKTLIAYGKSTHMVVSAAETSTATMTVQYRYLGTDAWTTMREIVPSRTVETTTFHFNPKPSGNVEFRAVQNDVVSNIATVGVSAKLTPMSISGNRVKKAVTLRGLIMPDHANDTTVVAISCYKGTMATKGKSRGKVTYASSPSMMLYGKMTAKKYLWQASWKPSAAEKGFWKFVATHEDELHRPSSTKAYLYVR